MKSIKLNISLDKFLASISINAAPADFPSEEEIYSYLNKNNIVYGLDKSAISEIAREKKSVLSTLIAQGEKPKGRLDWHIQVENPHKPTITKTNRADFKKLTSYLYIKKNAKIVSLLDASLIKNGNTVTGVEVEPDADELRLPKNKNIILSKDKITLVADVSGYVLWRENFLTMEDVLHIEGNVDYSTGNLKLKGSVIIDGDVRSGFSVETGGSIFVRGSVDASNLFAQNEHRWPPP